MSSYSRPARAGILPCLLSAIFALNSPAVGNEEAQNEPLKPFNDSTLERWKEKSFSGNSRYEIVEIDGTRVLKASTEGAASILYKEQTISLITEPVIRWSWKIEKVYEDIDESSRGGDDFPARLYVVVQTGMLPWQTLALNYVWSSNQDVGESWPNPFTQKAMMVAVQSGNSKAGQWVTQSRNIVEDFETHFGVKIDKINGYAVMVDGDNSNKDGTAWYADISFNPK